MGDRRHACNMLNKETLWHRPGISTTGGITLHNIELTEEWNTSAYAMFAQDHRGAELAQGGGVIALGGGHSTTGWIVPHKHESR